MKAIGKKRSRDAHVEEEEEAEGEQVGGMQGCRACGCPEQLQDAVGNELAASICKQWRHIKGHESLERHICTYPILPDLQAAAQLEAEEELPAFEVSRPAQRDCLPACCKCSLHDACAPEACSLLAVGAGKAAVPSLPCIYS